MALVTLTKQSWEKVDFDLDFAGKMADDAEVSSIVSITVVNVSGGAHDVTHANETIDATDGKFVRAQYAGGTSGQKYLVTGRVIDSHGQWRETEGYLSVKDVPT